MAPNPSQPWAPERSWADPFIAALVLVILLLAGSQLGRRAAPRPAEEQATLEGRLQDMALAARQAIAHSSLRGWRLPPADFGPAAAARRSGWDQALLAVHAAESGDLDAGAALIQAAPGAAGGAFRQTWTFCYRGLGAPPAPAEFQAVRQALGAGYAARILEARLRARSGADPGPLEAQARDWATRRLATLAILGLAGVLTALAGLGFALFLAVRPAAAVPLPHYGVSGRGLLIVMLGWFLALMGAGPLVAGLVSLLPRLRAIYLPLVYGCHALAGTTFILMAEGVDLATLRRRLAPGRHGRALAAGLGFLALAFAAVLAVAQVIGPLLPSGPPPQKELLENLAHLRGAWTVLATFLTVALLAPVFEELMFRGFLLPWLVERLGNRLGAQRGRRLAVAVAGLAFGAMHLQPLGLPTLATLGIVLGFAFLRTGNLLSAILVHGLWNGGVFLLMRALA